MKWGSIAAACLVAAAPLNAPTSRADEPQEVPFPTSRTTVLRDEDVVYVVDGRQRIPPGVEITGQQGIRIQGRNGGVIAVEGALVVHGVTGNEVHIQGVRIELEDEVKQLHLDKCEIAAGSGVVTPEGKTAYGMITIENCHFEGSPGIDLSLTGGKVKVMSVLTGPTVRIRGVDADGKKNHLYGMVYNGKLTGLDVENVDDLTVRGVVLKGSPLRLAGNRTLVFDTNHVEGGVIAFEQPEAGGFRKTKITKCDFMGTTIRCFAPAGESKHDRVTLDKCFFGGEIDPDAIAKQVEDSEDDPENNVRVLVKNPSKRAFKTDTG